jgi:hypothetical protein
MTDGCGCGALPAAAEAACVCVGCGTAKAVPRRKSAARNRVVGLGTFWWVRCRSWGREELEKCNVRDGKLRKVGQLESISDIGHLAMVVQSQDSDGANSGKV